MSKHTAGPWQISGAYKKLDGEIWHPIGPDNGGYIALVIMGKIDDPTHREAAGGDARLIAAAPDLLEALKRAVDDELGDNWRTEARAAIAAATGEKP